jgi:hypothetical protein
MFLGKTISYSKEPNLTFSNMNTKYSDTLLTCNMIAENNYQTIDPRESDFLINRIDLIQS